MKRTFAVVSLLCITAVPLVAQRAPDAVTIDPVVHHVLLENEHVRVFEARASRPNKSPMHSHPPFVFIGMKTARVKPTLPDGKNQILDISPGQVMWIGDVMQHAWELLSGELNVMAVEIKSAAKPASAALPAVTRKADDSVALHPDVHHVLFENEHVRVLDGKASKGMRSPMHSHPPTVLVALGWGRAKITTPDGKSMFHDYTPGSVLWAGEGMAHSWEMVAGDPHVVAVEVKSAQRAMAQKK